MSLLIPGFLIYFCYGLHHSKEAALSAYGTEIKADENAQDSTPDKESLEI